jgi:hypothetical protein
MKKLPPFDKGGQGGFMPTVVTKNQIPLDPLFQRGKWLGAMLCCDCRGAMPFLESVVASATESKDRGVKVLGLGS